MLYTADMGQLGIFCYRFCVETNQIKLEFDLDAPAVALRITLINFIICKRVMGNIGYVRVR